MDPQAVFCPNPACPARGQLGKGNIHVHSRQEQRYICDVCDHTFASTKGTVFYRRRLPPETIVKVITLLAYGCPRQAIVAAFQLDERTVKSLEEGAGEHCQRVHALLIEHPRDLGQVQADEIRAKTQGGVLWMAMAVQVCTRLWLGGVLSPSRDMHLIVTLIQKVRCGALCRPLLFCIDGCQTYIGAIHRVFREPILTGQPGRPPLRPWDGIHIAQVVKQYARKRVVGVSRRVVQGPPAEVDALLHQTQGGGVINTAYIERLNATFRARITALVRRGRALACQVSTLHQAMYLVGTVYNFCAYHKSLRVVVYLPHGRRRWLRRTPAIAAGLTDHRWSVEELLWFRVPPPSWRPPTRRGRPSHAMEALVAQWCA
jgi:transposase-like protein